MLPQQNHCLTHLPSIWAEQAFSEFGFLFLSFFPLSFLSHQMGRVGPSCTYWGMHPSPDLSPRRKTQCVKDRSARRDPREALVADATTSGIAIHVNRGENAVLWIWLRHTAP